MWVALWYVYGIFIVYLSYIYSMFMICCSIGEVRVLFVCYLGANLQKKLFQCCFLLKKCVCGVKNV